MTLHPIRCLRGPVEIAVALVACLLAACGPRGAASPEATRAKLVVALVYDQFGAAQLEKYMPYLSDDGAIKLGIRRGMFFPAGKYAYAGTYTAPGHTTIYSGVGPWKSGIVSNRVWNEARAHALPVMDDGKHPIIHHPESFASPLPIRAPVVADQLKQATGGRGRVVSLSIKDRAAIPGGGQRPDLVLWFDETAGGFTTSRYYAQELPAWLRAWRAKHPWERAMTTWTPQDARLCERVLGPDEQPGEGKTFGLDASFPHDPRATTSPSTVFKMTPQSTDYLLELATRAVGELQLGQDDVPDLLAISLSAVDYAGHAFGPDSCEYMDTLIRSDAAAGRFLKELSARTSIAVVLTSDHGVASFPERIHKGGRIFAPRFAEKLNEALVSVLGEGTWIGAYASPFFYLSEQGKRHRAKVLAAALRILDRMPGVYRAFDVAQVSNHVDDSDPIVRAVARSVYPGAGGDIFVVPAKFTIVDELEPLDHNTSHGSPWDYDALVPIIVWGPGIERGENESRVALNHVASTLARLLGVAPPKEAPREALPGVR